MGRCDEILARAADVPCAIFRDPPQVPGMTDDPATFPPTSLAKESVQGTVSASPPAEIRHSRRTLLAGVSAFALVAGVTVLVATGAAWTDGSLFDDQTGWAD
jgi:hypothetical protein